jgi:hypothetical protein
MLGSPIFFKKNLVTKVFQNLVQNYSLSYLTLVDVKNYSESTTTNAPVEDEAIEAILGMNQKHILPARNY